MNHVITAPTAPQPLAVAPQLGFLQNAIATFEGIERLAKVMASMGTMPAHLKDKPADCFRIVVQAAKWGMDPFAVAECTSLVHGRLCYEGKLVAAVLKVTGAIEGRLSYDISGSGQEASIVVTGTPRGGELSSISGSVADWRTHTMKEGRELPNAWDKDPKAMLVYRGTRQWARLYAPEALLGVYAPDEAAEVREVEAVVTSSVPEPREAKERVLSAETPAAGEQQTLVTESPSTPWVPTVKDLNEAAIAFAGAFKTKATEELKAINKRVGIEKMSLCPPDRVVEVLAIVKAAHAKMAADARAGAQ